MRDKAKSSCFALDTVAHYGAAAARQFCKTLTAMNLFSGRLEAIVFLNVANRWIQDAVSNIQSEIPYFCNYACMLPLAPTSDLERFLLPAWKVDDGVTITVTITVAGTQYLFFPGGIFSPIERSFFLSSGQFQFPLCPVTVHG